MDPNATDMLGFKDKVTIITGASSGLGYQVAVAMAMHGAKLALHGRDEQGMERTVRDCLDQGLDKHKIVTVLGDLREDAEGKRLMEAAVDAFGRIDILINNAGCVQAGTFEQCTVETLDRLFDTNVKAMYQLTRHVLPWLHGSKGCIVNVSSFTAIRPVNDYFAYGVSKAAVDAFTRNLALECGQVGVRVNSVNPGIMRDTNLWTRPGMPLRKNPLIGGMILKKVCTMYPIQRPSLVDEVVPTVLFLASEKCSSFTTGTNVLVDGGKALTSAHP